MAAIPRLEKRTYRRVERAASALCFVLWALAGIAVWRLWQTEEAGRWNGFWGLFLVVYGLRVFVLPRFDPDRPSSTPDPVDDGYRGPLPGTTPRTEP